MRASYKTLQKSSPELFGNLAWSFLYRRLPQFDRISLRVMQAGEPSVRVRLRVNLDHDSRLVAGLPFCRDPGLESSPSRPYGHPRNSCSSQRKERKRWVLLLAAKRIPRSL